ncbi:hypothetical protein DVH24_024445 [Malus domestica]|uniref:Protein kinase domain-containing protein n=1 Tax=Malus domestica TaxID=3750 RepID=A0A498JN60_MALDO|nr:hypothetical protein DVH24_024445 [Malus domestica]
MRIALGAAKGLAFLHGGEAQVIYHDFKSSNILLDSSPISSPRSVAKVDPAMTNRGGGKAAKIADWTGQEEGGCTKMECLHC